MDLFSHFFSQANDAHSVVIASIYAAHYIPQLEAAIHSNPPVGLLAEILHCFVSRAYTPRRAGPACLLYQCIATGLIQIEEVIHEIQKISGESHLQYIEILFALFPWIAPELEASMPEVFEEVYEYSIQQQSNEGIYPTVRRFVLDLEKHRANDWDDLKKRRSSSNNLKIYSAIFRRDDIEALKVNFQHPAFRIDQQISGSIFEPSFFVSNGPTLIQYATFCRADKCIAFLKEHGADETLLDSNGTALSAFQAAAGYSSENEAVAVEFRHLEKPLIHPAAISGNLHLIEQCKNINEKDNKGRTALHLASFYNHVDIVKYLLSQPGIEIDIPDNDGLTPLQMAAQNGNTEIVKVLLPKSNVNSQHKFGMSSLLWAAQKRFPDIASILIDAKALITLTDEEGWNVLHWAAFSDSPEIVRLVINAVDINAQQQDGFTPLHYAAMKNNTKIAKILLDDPRIDINIPDKDGMTALHTAASCGAVEIAALLKGTTLLMDNEGWSPLHWAAQNGHGDVITALQNIDPNIKNNAGETALMIAVQADSLEAVIALSMNPVIDTKVKDNDGKTVLHFACRNGDPMIVQSILDIPGIDVNARNKSYLTPLHLAVANNHTKVVSLLLQADGIEKSPKDDEGDTPLDTAMLFQNKEMIALLKENSITE